MCGAATSSYGRGAVPGYLSAFLKAGLRADAIVLEPSEGGVGVTSISGPSLVRANASFPAIIIAAPYGIAVRTISPILLMRGAKKPVETIGLAALASALPSPSGPLPSTGASNGPLESNRKRRLNEAIDGPDASARAITLVSALRERELV